MALTRAMNNYASTLAEERRTPSLRRPTHVQADDAYRSNHAPSTTVVLNQRPTPASGATLRARYLSTLGFTKGPVCLTKEDKEHRRNEESKANKQPFDHKSGDDWTTSTASLTTAASSSVGSWMSRSTTRAPRRNVRFDSTAPTVHLVPDRAAYDDWFEDLWYEEDEMDEMVERNTIEFAAEKKDWRQAVEELIEYKGELIHPCHFRRNYTMKAHFADFTD